MNYFFAEHEKWNKGRIFDNIDCIIESKLSKSKVTRKRYGISSKDNLFLH